MATINPYLTFNGSCEDAFNFYKSVFGGEFTYVGRFKDMPEGSPVPDSEKEKIMHISLPISKETVIMGSDFFKAPGRTLTQGDNFSISVTADSEENAKNIFNKLSEGGKVTMPMEKTFWGAYFGTFIDKFGINWMVSFDFNQG